MADEMPVHECELPERIRLTRIGESDIVKAMEESI